MLRGHPGEDTAKASSTPPDAGSWPRRLVVAHVALTVIACATAAMLSPFEFFLLLFYVEVPPIPLHISFYLFVVGVPVVVALLWRLPRHPRVGRTVGLHFVLASMWLLPVVLRQLGEYRGP